MPQQFATAKRVGIWVRVSTEDQARGDSPQHHEERARCYAKAKSWEVVEVYRLEGVSGKAVADHPETKRMQEDIRRGHITGLIFSKLARLARSTRDLLDFADFFRASDADIISLQESIDTSTPAGRLFYTMVAAMAQWEREEIADRVAASIPIRAKLGKPLGGAAPFGYQWANGELLPEPAEAPIRRKIYELFAEHGRKSTVADLLNQAGFRTRNGGEFSDTTIDRLLRDPTAKGVRRANYCKSLGNGKAWTLKPESEWVLVPVEAIVTEELWDKCNAMLAARERSGARPARRPIHLLAGLIVCECGEKMYVPSNTPKYVCRSCRNKIPIVDIEEIYSEQLRGYLLSADELTDYLSGADSAIREQEALLATLQTRRKKLEGELNRLFELHQTGEVPTQGFRLRYQPLQDELDQVTAHIPVLQADIDFFKINTLSRDQVLTDAQTLADRWPHLSLTERRQIAEAITNKITVGAEGIDIDLCYLPNPTELMATSQCIPRG